MKSLHLFLILYVWSACVILLMSDILNIAFLLPHPQFKLV